ncbi:hypothetical protein [Methanosarcina sp.]|uniref:hypothetical protein n=1 Tax=Methanosarcina sp. TaxID=2213 RepID=UPI003C791A65
MEEQKSSKIKKIVCILLAVLLILAVTVPAVSAEDTGVKEQDVPGTDTSSLTATPVNSDITCDLKDNGIPPD